MWKRGWQGACDPSKGTNGAAGAAVVPVDTVGMGSGQSQGLLTRCWFLGTEGAAVTEVADVAGSRFEHVLDAADGT